MKKIIVNVALLTGMILTGAASFAQTTQGSGSSSTNTRTTTGTQENPAAMPGSTTSTGQNNGSMQNQTGTTQPGTTQTGTTQSGTTQGQGQSGTMQGESGSTSGRENRTGTGTTGTTTGTGTTGTGNTGSGTTGTGTMGTGTTGTGTTGTGTMGTGTTTGTGTSGTTGSGTMGTGSGTMNSGSTGAGSMGTGTSGTTGTSSARTMTTGKDLSASAMMSNRHTILLSALRIAGLADQATTGGPYTVFAPTDDAFNRMPSTTLDNLLKPRQKAQLTRLLGHHVVQGTVMSSDLQDGQTLTTLAGETLTVKKQGDRVMITDGKGKSANITQADIQATNGVVHSIDTVLMPLKAK